MDDDTTSESEKRERKIGSEWSWISMISISFSAVRWIASCQQTSNINDGNVQFPVCLSVAQCSSHEFQLFFTEYQCCYRQDSLGHDATASTKIGQEFVAFIWVHNSFVEEKYLCQNWRIIFFDNFLIYVCWLWHVQQKSDVFFHILLASSVRNIKTWIYCCTFHYNVMS